MTLAPEQAAWADKHIGERTELRLDGTIEEWSENDLGQVVFVVRIDKDRVAAYSVVPPETDEQRAARKEAEAEDERRRQAAAEQAEAEAEARRQAQLEAEREKIRQEVQAELLSTLPALVEKLVNERSA